jgi:Tol biopolymer transport system component
MSFISCSISQNESWEYLNESPPGDIPKIFGKGIVSVDNKNSHALAISPDGKTIIFSRYPDRTSYILTFENGKWSEPGESFFYGKEVSFSSDGKKIFYYTEGDIFFVEKKNDGWSNPIRMGENINTAEAEYYPCIVDDGSMYFSRDGNWKTGRLMYSRFSNGNYMKAVDLGLPINSGGALHAWISPDESYMLFNSPREGSFTQNDIWVSFRKNDGSWTIPINAGEKINSGADAILCPTVSPDGKYMFFTKLNFNPTTGNIYWVSTKFIYELRGQ